jgi:predicted permease
MDTLWQDVRFAARLLAKERWFTFAATLALALGIGANTAVFTMVNAVLLRGVPFEDPDRVMWIGMRDNRNRESGMSLEDFDDIRRASVTFAGLSAISPVNFNLSDEGRAPEQYSGVYISGQAFSMLGQRPALGRTLLAQDDGPGAPPVVVLGNGVWKTRYGAEPGILGRVVKLNQLSATVVGVMPEGMRFPPNSDLWLPLEHLPGALRERGRQVRQLQVIGRLAPGVSVQQASSELRAIGAQLAKDFPASNRDTSPVTMRYNDRVNGGPIRFVFLAAMGAVAFVLLIACANVANLLLARAAHRSREISVRVSLGATRWRIVRQLLAESVLLAAVGGALGLAVALAGVRLFDAATSDPQLGKPYYIQFTMDATVFAFVAALSLGTGLLFGLAPALHVSKTNVNDVLKEGGRSGSVGGRTRRWAGALIVSELALTMVLLAGAAFMMRSFLSHYRMDTGISTTRLLLMNLSLPDRKYRTHEDRIAFIERVDERLGGVAAFEAATTASQPPLLGGGIRQLTVDGRAQAAGETLPAVTVVTVGARYFETIGAPLVAGRGFVREDGAPGHENAVVNQRLAAMYFPGDDPVGRRIGLTEETPTGPPVPPLTIVGVSKTVRQRAQTEAEADPVVYLPTRGNPNAAYGTTLLVRSRTDDAAGLIPVIREEIRALDPDMPVFNIRTLDEALAQQRWPMRVFGGMFALFAFVALVLSTVGLYAVTAYSVTQRTQEIGVRMALGAQPRQVWWLVFRRAAAQLGAGLALGLVGAVGAGRLLQQLPFVQTSSYDPATLTSIAAILVGVAIGACFWPARRATRLDPVIALRYE